MRESRTTRLFTVTSTPTQIEFALNGEPQALPAGATVADLIARLALRPELVAVECNGSVVRRSEHATRPLAQGDVVEVVTLVGGG